MPEHIAHTHTYARTDTSIYLQTGQVCENGCSEKHLPPLALQEITHSPLNCLKDSKKSETEREREQLSS